MNSKTRDTTSPAAAAHDERQADHCEQERREVDERPIGAAQLAAPSTRRWRRPERTERSS